MTRALHIYDEPPAGVAEDWTMPQAWESFSGADHERWSSLVGRQTEGLQDFASREFLNGLDVLKLGENGIPDFRDLNPRMMAATGWEVVAVPGVIPNAPFFKLLSERRFPVANFLRQHDSLDYNDEPDLFHDVFGHLPMFIDRTFGDFMAAYGRAGMRAESQGVSDLLGRLYLHTVEFGLIEEGSAIKAYGAGLLSSYAETVHAVTSDEATRLRFNLPRMMRTDYPFDTFQPTYFVIESFAALLEEMETTSLAEIYKSINGAGLLAPGASDPSDVAYSPDNTVSA